MSTRAQVELKIGGKPWRVEFEAPVSDSVRPAELLPVLRKFSDVMVASAEAAATEAISCTKGCGACCRQLVPIREMEARRLAAFVQSLPEPRRSTILERFTSTGRRLKDAGMRERIDGRDALDRSGRLALKLDYFALGIACPFLEDESCGIYEERPMICREHLVTSPMAACADPRAGGIHTLPMHRADSAAAKLEARPDGPEWIALIDLLDWVSAHSDDEAACQDPRDMLQQFLRDLTA